MLAVLIHVTQGVKPMSDTMLPFSLAKSNEKLTDRGTIALVDEFAEAIGLPEKVDGEFPAPGSNRGIDPSAYVTAIASVRATRDESLQTPIQNFSTK